MSQLDLSAVPDPHRETVASALVTTFGPGGVTSVAAVPGGASGALTYRVEARTGAHLLRLETIRGPLRNPHQYDCMQIAAEAGIAPPIRFVDADAGVVVMPFLAQRPLTDFPGGPPALAAAGGTLLARVHRTPTFPASATTWTTSPGCSPTSSDRVGSRPACSSNTPTASNGSARPIRGSPTTFGFRAQRPEPVQPALRRRSTLADRLGDGVAERSPRRRGNRVRASGPDSGPARHRAPLVARSRTRRARWRAGCS